MRVGRLSQETLEETIELYHRIFPYHESEPETADISFPASLNPKAHKEELKATKTSKSNYWVAVKGEKVIGFTGLYSYEHDKENSYWLDWTGVDPDFRRRGIGSHLLKMMIEEARNVGKIFLRVYVSDHPNEAAAVKMYEKFGFVLTRAEPSPLEDATTNYYLELRLE